ncbi:GTP-binding protein 1, partial [Gonapodya sp. JEL0774]
LVSSILRDYRIHNAEILVREDASVDEFIDVVLGNRKYMKCLYVYNKVDAVSIEEVDRLAHLPNSVVCSTLTDLNLDYLVDSIWRGLDLLTIYTKRRGELPDFEGGVIMRRGATVED